ncbi:MAG: OsmC family protein, partial [Pseudomonadota bacterium]
MDMNGQDQRRFEVTTRHVDNYRYQSQAHENGVNHGEPFNSDEPLPVGESSAPATPALLGSALGHCLSAALLEALRKARLNVTESVTETVVKVSPNEDGNPRIDEVDIVIKPTLEELHPRKDQCAAVFENYCTVTSSVKRGINVNVSVEWVDGS